MSDQRVVVTGIGVVTAVGCEKEEFWSNISAGRSGIGPVRNLPDRLPISVAAQVDLDVPERYLNYHRPDQFAVIAAGSALRDAGIDIAQISPERVGLSVTASKANISIAESFRQLRRESAGNAAPYSFSHPNGALARELGLCGPASIAVSACASGAHSIIAGAAMLRAGQADVVVAGATESYLTPLVAAGFRRMGVLSDPDASGSVLFCPFDRRRSGFVIGEGAGVVILERSGGARARGARVYGEIAGWANSGDGFHPTHFDPAADSIGRAISLALERAGLDGVDYLNCHATATVKNDILETAGIKKGLGEKAYRASLSATKPLTGHLLGASGSVSFIIGLLAMERGFVPPTVNLADPDPACDLDYTPNVGVCRDIASAMSLSFGFGGHIGVLVARKAA
ncbi:MAG TPA: beta-ketoacyl-[acyl-carrier-protein] synthase family protein [bacterium]|nr:beta-ketoacyl-[acyl-carrier-protein] synthase family protein [bacterium]